METTFPTIKFNANGTHLGAKISFSMLIDLNKDLELTHWQGVFLSGRLFGDFNGHLYSKLKMNTVFFVFVFELKLVVTASEAGF